MGAAAASVHGWVASVARSLVVPANAGTHNHRCLLLRKPSARVPNREAAAYRSRLKAGTTQKSDPRHHHVFDLDIFFHAVMRAFAAQAAFLDAAERRHFGGDQPRIDADHAGLQAFGDPPDPAEIARIEI